LQPFSVFSPQSQFGSCGPYCDRPQGCGRICAGRGAPCIAGDFAPIPRSTKYDRQAGCPHPTNKNPGGHKKTSIWIPAAALAICAAFAMLLPVPGERAAAQSGGLYINAVDLDIVPAQRDNYLAAIKENSMAAIQEPGCKQFDILVLASDPNHIFLYEVYDNEAAFPRLRAFQEICGPHRQHGRQARIAADGRNRHEREAALAQELFPDHITDAPDRDAGARSCTQRANAPPHT
jgi:hypothetical protein